MPFDPSALAPFIGGAGNPTNGSAFLRGWQRAQQEIEARKLRTQQMGVQQEQLGFQRDSNTRANEAQEIAKQQRLMQAVQSIQSFLGNDAIDDPDLYAQREAEMLALAPRVGVEEGFVRTLRPQDTVFQQRRAAKALKQIEETYSAQQLAMFEADDQSGTAPTFPVNGEQLTLAQIRARAGRPTPSLGGKPMSLRKATEAEDYSKSGLDVQAAAALRRGDTEEYQRLLQAKREVGQADDRPVDPELAGINKSLAQLRLDQAQNAAKAPTPALPPATQRRVDMKTRAFDSQPVVKRIQTMAESVTFAEGLDVNTKNPADDQALIYAFAKAMDPDSVVREGEYATVQKYAQSWAESFGFNAQRIFSNSIFLTPQARANMKATIRARFAAARPQYDNLRTNYARQVNQITGSDDGDSYLVDYAAAFPAAPGTSAPAGPTAQPSRGNVPNPWRR